MRHNRVLVIAILTVVFQSTIAAGGVVAQSLSTQWGGQGSIQVQTPTVSPGGPVMIQYSIFGSRGTAAGVYCVVVSPSGRTLTMHQSFQMPGGSGSTTFQFTAGDESGGYMVFCYWYIRGYGVDGPTCPAYAMFRVE